MGNTLGTTNADVIAQEALTQLVALLPVVGQIASDFSTESAVFNETVIVHEVTAAAAAPFNKAVGYVPTDRTQVDIPVKIDQHVHHTYSVGVQEASSSRVDLIRRFAQTAAYSVGASMVNAICDLIVAENFKSASVLPLGDGLDGFNRKSLVRVGTALDKRHVAPFGRFALLNADYYGSLMSDSALMTVLLQSGADAVKTGRLPQVHGFDVSQYSSLPDNDEHLVGFAGTRTALAMATRIPDDPGKDFPNCSISVVTEAQTGLSIQVREWYESTLAQYRRTYTLMFGVAAGQTGCLQRIVEQAAPAAA